MDEQCAICTYTRFTVIICALSSADIEDGFGLPLKSLWKACIAPAVTSFEHKRGEKKKCVKLHNSVQQVHCTTLCPENN